MMVSNTLRSGPHATLLFAQVILLLLLPCGLALASEASPGSRNTHIQALLDVSGVQAQVDTIPHRTAESFDNIVSSETLPGAFAQLHTEDMLTAITQAFSVDAFNDALHDAVASSLTHAQVGYVQNWYRTDLGRRFVSAQQEAFSEKSQSAFYEYHRSPAPSMETGARLAMLHQLDEQLQMTDAMVRMMSNMQIAFNMSLSSTLAAQDRWSTEEIIQYVRSQEAGLADVAREVSESQLSFMLREFNDQEVAEILAWFGDDVARAYSVAVNQGINNGMFASSLLLGDKLSVLMQASAAGAGI